MVLNIFVLLIAFASMEFVAWFTHKYIMHGFLWFLHKDHHIRDGRRFEWNDIFALIFAIPSIVLIYLGWPELSIPFYIGIGIMLYGMAYFLFHDALVHGRIKVFKKHNNWYLKATLKAHLEHHTPHKHYNYGFLVVPFKYYREALKNKK